MNLPYAVEKATFHGILGLPERVQRVLAGRPVVVDGNRLATDVQLTLRLKQVARIPQPEAMPPEEGRAETRHQASLAAGNQPIGGVRDLDAGGLPARLYSPTHPVPGALLVFFHGGGFMYGDLESHDAACRFLARTSSVPVLAIDYRLGPEHRFPAAHDDALTAYRWVIDHAEELGADPAFIGVGGDSAGGNLAAWVALEAARNGWPCRAQMLVYPATDAQRKTESARLFAEGFYLTKAYMDIANERYAPSEADLADERLSPIHAEIPDGLAPALVFTAGFDPLRDEGEAYARRLEDAGVQVTATRFPDQIHGFFNIVGVGRSSPRANRRMALALRMAMQD